MAKILNLYEAKTRLSAIVDQAADGADIVIAKAGVPLVRLVPFKAKAQRRPGGWRGRLKIADDFDAPLPSDLLAAFEGKSPGTTRRRK